MYTQNSNQTNGSMAGYLMGTLNSSSADHTMAGMVAVMNNHTAGSEAADLFFATPPAARLRSG
jgi:hypothetical protein